MTYSVTKLASFLANIEGQICVVGRDACKLLATPESWLNGLNRRAHITVVDALDEHQASRPLQAFCRTGIVNATVLIYLRSEGEGVSEWDEIARDAVSFWRGALAARKEETGAFYIVGAPAALARELSPILDAEVDELIEESGD